MPIGESRIVFQGRRFLVEREMQVSSDGREHVWEFVRHPGAAVILPLLDDGRLCLLRSYRPAIRQTMIELPAGTLERGEDPAETARRELAEETGYRAGRIEHMISFYSSPGIFDEHMHLYLAQDLTPGPMSLDPGEQIEPLLCSWEEAFAMIRSGEIRDAKTLTGLLYGWHIRRSAGTGCQTAMK
jgi:ADP-ribose pyrophosphatase